MPAVSPTLWVPVLKGSAVVVPPSPALPSSVVPSICRLKRPGSPSGSRSLITSIVPVSRVLVIVQTMSSFASRVTFSGPSPESSPGRSRS